jgi:hypothetical protein
MCNFIFFQFVIVTRKLTLFDKRVIKTNKIVSIITPKLFANLTLAKKNSSELFLYRNGDLH